MYIYIYITPIVRWLDKHRCGDLLTTTLLNILKVNRMFLGLHWDVHLPEFGLDACCDCLQKG